jgi:hypothetical protein
MGTRGRGDKETINAREERMTYLLIIIAAIVVIYIYAAIAYYYGFKEWNPFCGGCKGASCAPRKTT